MQISYKKKVILSILESVPEGLSAKCLQKYLFVFTRQQQGTAIYDFVPYRYGCFSFNANQDILSLEKNSYIFKDELSGENSIYKRSPGYRYTQDLDLFDRVALANIVSEFCGLSSDEIIAYTYRRWPFTAINSLVKEHLLTHAELARVEEQAQRCHQDSSPTLFTIGYEGLSLERYLRILITNNVKLLCDVRKNAFSMKYGFSKAILQKACEGVGIHYVHISALGIENTYRESLLCQADYDALFSYYEANTLRENWSALLYVKSLLDTYGRICLTCYEKDPRQCHRTRIAYALLRLYNEEIPFRQLFL